MRAVKTKYLGPTNHKGSRIKATDGVNSLTCSYGLLEEHVQELSRWKQWREHYHAGIEDAVHHLAARKLLEKIKSDAQHRWGVLDSCRLYTGSINGEYYHVLIPKECEGKK